MLKVVVAFLLVFSAVECAVACTPCAAAETTCHHHKQSPSGRKASCTHELIPATTVPIIAMDVSLAAEPAPVFMPAMVVSFGHATVEASSPPISPILVLRI